MPGTIQNAAPATTFPQILAVAFTREHSREAYVNVYVDGESQRKCLVGNSRKRWQRTHRLTPTQVTTLRNFYDARGGPLEAFYFYDPAETSPAYTATPSGTQGRYTVRFEGDWSQQMSPGRGEVATVLIEVA